MNLSRQVQWRELSSNKKSSQRSKIFELKKEEETSPPFTGAHPASHESSPDKDDGRVIDNGMIYQDSDNIYYYGNDEFDSPDK